MEETTQLQQRQFSATVLAAFSMLCLGMALQLLSDMPANNQQGVVAGVSTVSSNAPAMNIDQTNYSVRHVVTPSKIELQAEDFTSGNPGFGYWDNTKGNEGSAYRESDVDIISLVDKRFVVKDFTAGEWLKYEVSNVVAGTYRPLIKVSTNDAAVIGMEVNGQFIGRKGILPTGSAVFVDVNIANNVQLTSGRHQIRIIVDSGDINLDAIELVRID